MFSLRMGHHVRLLAESLPALRAHERSGVRVEVRMSVQIRLLCEGLAAFRAGEADTRVDLCVAAQIVAQREALSAAFHLAHEGLVRTVHREVPLQILLPREAFRAIRTGEVL